MSSMELTGKIAVVTGGGSGIGKAAAIRFAQSGAKVYMLDRTPDSAEETKREIAEAGGSAAVIECDISKPEMVQAAYEQIGREEGHLSIVFANAGINGTMAPIETMEMDEWQRTIDINLRGTFATVKYAIPYLKDNGGSIIITSSINGNRVFSNIGFSAYATTKAAQVAFMKMAALELARYKIRVNAICPGAIETSIGDNTFPTDDLEEVKIPVEFPEGDHPLKQQPGGAAEVAALVHFLASDAASHVTGTEIYIDGAESLLRG